MSSVPATINNNNISQPSLLSMSTSTTPKPIPPSSSSSTPNGGVAGTQVQNLSSSPSQHLHGLLLPQHHHHQQHHQQPQTISSILSQAAAFNTSNNTMPSMVGGGPIVPTSTGLSINTMSAGPPGPSGAAFSSSSSQPPRIHSPATPQSNGGGGGGGYTSSETWSSVVHSLMCHLQSSDNEQFAKRAIESLAKKLKDKPDEMDALMQAVQKKGQVPTKCITIPRTLDGRLQVAGRKGFPHVIYARLWRWPDLHKNELKHTPVCAYPFDLKLDNVCVNPYHYQRVISPGFDLAGLTLSGRSFNGQYGGGPHSPSKLDSSVGSNNGDSVSIKHEPTNLDSTSGGGGGGTSKSSSSNGSSQSQNNNGSTSSSSSSNNNNFVPQQLPFSNLYIQNPVVGQSSSSSSAQPHQHHHHHHQSHHHHHQQHHSSSNQPSFYPTPTQQSVVAAVLPPTSNGSNNIVLYPINQSSMDPTATNNSTNTSTSSRPSGRLTQEWQGSYPPSSYSSNQTSSVNGGPYNPGSELLWLQEEFPEIELSTPPSDYWCTVTYFEGDLQIGDMFKVRSCYSSFIVDGFFDASREDRFCLGALTNVQRTSASEKARLHIGKGVQIENNMSGDGSVYVRALSDYSLFFESYYLDRESGREAFDAVHKIYPGSCVKVFSLKECLRCLKMATVQMQQQQSKNNTSTSSQQDGSNSSTNGAANNNNNNNGLNVDDLRKLCRLRFSFVKGWGPDYMRKNILDTPCWCEIQLNRPLQYLDQLINSLSRTTNLTSVFSD